MPEPAHQQLRQVSFPRMCPVEDDFRDLAAAGVEECGAIFTRRKVVEFILDLLRYTPDRALYKANFRN